MRRRSKPMDRRKLRHWLKDLIRWGVIIPVAALLIYGSSEAALWGVRATSAGGAGSNLDASAGYRPWAVDVLQPLASQVAQVAQSVSSQALGLFGQAPGPQPGPTLTPTSTATPRAYRRNFFVTSTPTPTGEATTVAVSPPNPGGPGGGPVASTSTPRPTATPVPSATPSLPTRTPAATPVPSGTPALGMAISGRIRSSVGGVAGVTVWLSNGASATTGGSGDYRFDGLLPGVYIVQPAMDGCTFSPGSRTITLATGDSGGNDFSARCGAQATATPVPNTGPTPTRTPLPSSTPLPTYTYTPQPTSTPQPSNTPEPTSTPLPTNTPEPTSTPLPTNTPTPTDTPEPTSTPLATDTPAPTSTPLPSDTPLPDGAATANP